MSPTAGLLALLLAAAALLSLVLIAAFFSLGEPFGTLNDLANGAMGVLAGLLAWRLATEGSGPGGAWLGIGLVGAAVVVAGTVLVVGRFTGWVLAGQVTGLGFGMIGLWLLALGVAGHQAGGGRGVSTLAVAAGAVCATGILTVPGILLRYDDAATLPAWAWIGFVNWLGAYLLLPAWAAWAGVVARRAAG